MASRFLPTTMSVPVRPYTRLAYVRHPWTRHSLLPFLTVVISLSLGSAILSPINRTAAGRFASAIYVLVVLMCLAELVLGVISVRVKGLYFIRWTEQEFAILFGCGAKAGLSLIAYTALVLRILHLQPAPLIETFFQMGPPGAFCASALIWLAAFRKPEHLPTEPQSTGKMRDALRVIEEQLEAELEAAKELARRLGRQRTHMQSGSIEVEPTSAIIVLEGCFAASTTGALRQAPNRQPEPEDRC